MVFTDNGKTLEIVTMGKESGNTKESNRGANSANLQSNRK